MKIQGTKGPKPTSADLFLTSENERERESIFLLLSQHTENNTSPQNWQLAVGSGQWADESMKPVCVRKMLLASNAPVKDTSLSAAAVYDRLVSPIFFFSQTHLNHSHMPLVSFITSTGQPHSKETK